MEFLTLDFECHSYIFESKKKKIGQKLQMRFYGRCSLNSKYNIVQGGKVKSGQTY